MSGSPTPASCVFVRDESVGCWVASGVAAPGALFWEGGMTPGATTGPLM